jgi:glycosyltransferase involved in cell wall biosynthesis
MSAEKLPRAPSMLALVGDMSGPTLWRVLQPFTALEKRGYPAAWDMNDAHGIGEVAAAYDGVVLARLGWQPEHRPIAEGWFRAMRRARKLVVMEADDDVFSPEIDRRTVALGWTDGKTPERLEAARLLRIWTLRQCDGVTVSTRRLATVVRGLTDRPVVVVPNAIDLGWFRRVLRAQPRQVPSPTIGWAGGKRPDEDLAPMAEAWGRVARRCPSVRFVVGGYLPPVVATAVPEDRLVVVPWLPLERYPAGLRDVDVACCSVADTPFNRCKSPIKAYEAAVAGAAVVATPTLYGALIEHGATGYLAETADDWEAALVEMVERPALRSIMARRLLRVVERHHTLDGQLWRWPAAWAQIAERAGEQHVVA